jgi:hypothetical protein
MMNFIIIYCTREIQVVFETINKKLDNDKILNNSKATLVLYGSGNRVSKRKNISRTIDCRDGISTENERLQTIG